ncbi:MAG TPA: cytochrome P460 family protein [Bacteroidia bacterium]|nr:cytochrome P460 family protein [Bacteroidia bacterium]
MKAKKIIHAVFMISVFALIVSSCKKDKAEEDANQALIDEVNSSGYTYYQNGTLLSGVSPSPHGSFKLRFNNIAKAALVGNSFPTGSIIVKELFVGTTLDQFAVMKKDASNANAGSGWVWAEFKPDGTVTYSAANKGSGCIGCHSGTPNRDLIRTFDLH